ncbi:MAG: radical SAM protein [Chloracidobacterium sp. CP2_5A]|nr:MAG: radical SAM protein [Chloracidobacterium sp. CP2_5A]
MTQTTFGKDLAHEIDPVAQLHLTYVYGPVPSRRLGVSLGVNPLPVETKVCNFDCPYCECGWTVSDRPAGRLPSVETVAAELEAKLAECQAQGVRLDAITFAGNGEPTLHPSFRQMIEASCALRDAYAPQAKVAVLTNATRLRQPNARAGLMRADIRQFKLDAGTEAMFRRVDRPFGALTLARIVDDICAFDAPKMLQSMFFRGQSAGAPIDNAAPEEVEAWLQHVARIRPTEVHLYSLDRTPAEATLEKVSRAELEAIAERVRELGVRAEVF